MRDVEATCQVCGGANIVWFIDSDRWNLCMDRPTIACPVCFVRAHEAATGMSTTWTLVPTTPFRWIEQAPVSASQDTEERT